jgi:hypothetical protein
MTLLGIWVNLREMTTTEAGMAHSKILVNEWRNEPLFRDQLRQQLAFTKSAQEPENYDENTISLAVGLREEPACSEQD